MANEKIELVKGGQNVDGVFKPNTSIKPVKPITVTDLQDVPLPSMTNTNTTPVLAAGLQGAIQSSTDQFTQSLQAQADTSREVASSSLEAFINNTLSSPGETELTAIESAKTIDPIRQELNDINSQILNEQRGLEKQIRELDKNKRGLFGGALEDEKRRVTAQSLERQADLSIIQMAVQGRFDSAKEIADRAVAVKLEQSKRINDVLGFLYQENKDLFDKDEQRAFESAQSDRERKLANEEADARALSAAKLEAIKMAQLNGAPASVLASIQSSQTPEEVFSKGGQYASVDLLERSYKRQQIASSRTNQLLALAAAGDQKAISQLGFDPSEVPEKLDSTTKRNTEASFNATNDLLRMATEYKSIIDTHGFTNEIFGSSEILGEIQSLRGQMTAAYKDAKKLGTLDAGLLELMDSILGDTPTSSIFGIGPEANILGNLTGRQSKKISSSMQQLIDETAIENARNAHLLGKEPWSDPLDLDLPKPNTQNTSTNPLNI